MFRQRIPLVNGAIYHSFHEEVAVQRKHWWRCNGPCKDRRPFYGWVKRATNRAPGPNDVWWAEHKASCDGIFIKVKEPEGFKDKKRTKAAQTDKSGSGLNGTKLLTDGSTWGSPTKPASTSSSTPHFVPFSGKGYTLSGNSVNTHNKNKISGGSSVKQVPPSKHPLANQNGVSPSKQHLLANRKRALPKAPPPSPSGPLDKFVVRSPSKPAPKPLPTSGVIDLCADLEVTTGSEGHEDVVVICPVCDSPLPTGDINQHLDLCLISSQH